ncbi:hypothetical protein B0H19DRAFT_913071, partial [Mycena capillaripes]
ESLNKGRHLLHQNPPRMASITEAGDPIHDNFAQLLILELTNDRGLVELGSHDRTWNYFIGRPVGTTEKYPDDVDTTSYALRLLEISPDIVHSVLDEIISPGCTTHDGIIRVYFDDARDQIDPTVCVNVVRCFYYHGRGREPALGPTKDWICAMILDRGYVHGTRYYPSPDVFLFFFARLLQENPDSDIHRVAAAALRAGLKERAHAKADALAFAMRVLAFDALGIQQHDSHLRHLLDLQLDDGAWPTGWLCRYGKTGIKLGNKYLTTALALKAV